MIQFTMTRFLIEIIIVSTFLSVLFGSNATAQPNITAKAWIVADSTGKILDGTHTTDVRAIASITKLMTSLIVLDSSQSMTEIIPKKLYNKNLSRQELLNLAIVKSDNNAAKMLCDYYTGGFKSCVQAMNDKAATLEMHSSKFTDPTGLYNTNVSTAEDLVKLVMAASKYPAIVAASNTPLIKFAISKKKTASFHNTNNLVGQGIPFIVSKTGWISASGGCIVMMLRAEHGVRTVILLGSKNTKTRIPEAYMLSALL